MSIQTLDIEKLKEVTGNKYELLVIMSKRASNCCSGEIRIGRKTSILRRIRR